MTTDPESANWPTGWQQTRDTAAGNPPPTVGRIVHWVDRSNGRSWPAIVVQAEGTMVDITVLNPLPNYFKGVAYDPDGSSGTWHWPERA